MSDGLVVLSGLLAYFKLPGEEIVPVTENMPMPLSDPRKIADPAREPPPVAPANRPVPPTTV